MFQELKRLIEQMGKDRGIDKLIITEALEAAMMTAARKNWGRMWILKPTTMTKPEKLKFSSLKRLLIKCSIPKHKFPKRMQEKPLMRERSLAILSV